MKKRNCVLICTIVFLIILAVILVVVRMTPDQKYKRAMKNAERYMNKLEYKQAGLQYEAAVEIKPKEAEPHLGLAAVYISIADGFDEDNTEEISEYYNLAKKEYEMAEEYGAKHSDLAVVAEGIEKIEKNAGLAEPSPEALDPPKPTVEPTAEPTVEPTAEPTVEPTAEPTVEPTEAPAPKSDFDVQAYLESLEAEASVIEERLYLSDMTQNAMNSDAKELYELWDSGLNDIWRELHNVLPSDQMETLLSEQKQWIDYKEAKILAEGEEYAGGSMRPLVENSTGATLTEVRCYVLAKYFDKPFSSIGRSADVRQFAYMVGMKEGEFLSYIGSPTADECKQGPEYGFLKEENVLPFALEGMDGYLYWLIENGEIVEVIWLLSSSNESDSNRFVYELPELCKAMVSKDWYEERENTMKGEHAPGYYQWPYHGRSLQIDAHQTGTIIFGNYTLNEVMTSNSRY